LTSLLKVRKFYFLVGSGANPVNWFGQTSRALKAQRVPEGAPFVVVMLPVELDASEYIGWAQQSVVPLATFHPSDPIWMSEFSL
jgi:hypothetical protein